ncbi:ubiquinone biosynthesis protein coq4, mitochondrial [Hyaloscypha hepaticicola]|uniref:4-hydroxy-3-methoxy-5-polyprenylbenzoate decarboxylase n=1 Tax=Hyaloscypha hepaticicola TaxID=2082293 RepID=A0A2J6PK08_9HELO|nr:ubiquinone biosynthesis protein coq4, mitochondrial [Hyaloscypha hepaticicola]
MRIGPLNPNPNPETSFILEPFSTSQLTGQLMTMALLVRQQALKSALPRELLAACSLALGCRHFSVLNRPPPNYPGHVPLTRIEKAGLAVGSAVMSLMDPHRGDLIAALGEATATPYFIYRLRDAMLSDPTGRRILRNRPRISSKTLSMEYLRGLPANTVGRTYAEWLDREGVSPDTRSEVQYIDDEECAYVMQRYRECHDFYHALTGLPIVREGEIALKAFEFANTLLPMTALSTFAVTTLKKNERERFWKVYLPWAVKNGTQAKEVINIYWEEQLERDVNELRAELGVEKPVDLRNIRKAERERRRAEKEAKNRAGDSLGIN